MNDDVMERRVRVLSALASRVRLEMVEILEAGERSVSELAEVTGLDLSTVSRHLAVLREAGIVSSKAVGNRRLHALRAVCVPGFLECIDEIPSKEPGNRRCAGYEKRHDG